MPGGDRTGPLGQGPMTGRGLGYCAGNSVPGFGAGFGGRGGRGGFGSGGRGFRSRFCATGMTGWPRAGTGRGAGPGFQPTPPYSEKDQLEGLKAQAEQLEESLQGIRQQIEAMEGQGKE